MRLYTRSKITPRKGNFWPKAERSQRSERRGQKTRAKGSMTPLTYPGPRRAAFFRAGAANT